MADTETEAPTKRRWPRRLALGLGLLVVSTISACALISDPLPTGKTGPEADALAKRMLLATRDTEWQKTGAVTWNFAGREQHLWDRRRGFAKIEWKDKLALIDLASKRGRIWEAGVELQGEALEDELPRAYHHWVNDAFWLNPVTKIFDQGVTRTLVEDPEHGQALLISFASGGDTPGDSYLFILDSSGLPKAWKMWVSIIPIGGLEASWEGWQEVASGARIATKHKISVLTLELKDLRAASSLRELLGDEDPFAPLLELLGRDR